MPLLQFDLVGVSIALTHAFKVTFPLQSLPPELSLQIFNLLPATALLICALVCRRWNVLANDQTLWRNLCHIRGWEWRNRLITPSSRRNDTIISASASGATREDRDEDEGMGDEEEGEDEGSVVDTEEAVHIQNGDVSPDNEFISMNLSIQDHNFQTLIGQFTSTSPPTALMPISRSASVATMMIRTLSQGHALPNPRADYKLLHQTQTLVRNRVRRGAYCLRTLRGAEGGGHTAAVYCLALWSYDSPYGPLQVLFTGSKDRTVREWDLNTSKVRRRVVGMHASSVLSLCVTATALLEDGTSESADYAREGYKSSETGILVSGGSDCRVVVWDLAKFKLIKTLKDHQDSVLCVRIDNGRLVSCSKGTEPFAAWCGQAECFYARSNHSDICIPLAQTGAGSPRASGGGQRSVNCW